MKYSFSYMKYVLSFVLFSLSIISRAQLASEIPTSYDVSSTGAFQYSIPLRIPPGIKNMVPNLSINYSSTSSNGILGVGWSLGGLSKIVRTNSTIHHDGQLGAIDFNDDPLLLDGQRLFESGGYYYTEIKNFAEIRYIAANNCFIVKYPSGIRYEYGNTSDSRLLAQGSTTDALTWAVNRIEDAHGNFVKFEYHNSQALGEFRISRIVYGENATNSNGIPVEINFQYMNRADANKTWYAGSEVKSDVLLDNIVVNFDNASQANKYHFTYDVNNLSRLVKIEELRDGTAKMPDININWGNPSSSVTATTLYLNSSKKSLTSGDFNGDGFTDVVASHVNGAPALDVFINDKNGGFNTVQNYNIAYNSSNWAIGGRQTSTRNRLTFDYDGDGLDDIIVVNTQDPDPPIVNHPYYRVYLLRANGSSSIFDNAIELYYAENTINNSSNQQNYCQNLRFIPGDFDGDGKSELVIAQPYHFTNPNSVNDYEIILLGHEYGAHKIYHFSFGHIDGGFSMDYDGDGKDEFIFNHIAAAGTQPKSYTFGLKLSYNSLCKPSLVQTSTSWPINIYSFSDFPHTNLKNWIGDYNGDGKDDLISWTLSNVWLKAYSDATYSTFTNRAPSVVSSPMSGVLDVNGPANVGDVGYFSADFNGDGLTDFLQLKSTSVGSHVSNYDMFYSNGASFNHQSGTIPVDPDERLNCIGDFNGDGQMDLLNSYGDYTLVLFQSDNNTLRVKSIEHADKIINLEYNNISKIQSYTRSTHTSDAKLTNRIFPIKVVTRVYDNVSLDNSYTYDGMLFHKYGLGFRGFEKTSIQNSVGQKTYHTFNILADFPYLQETQIFDPWNGMPFGRKINYLQVNENGGVAGKCRIIMPIEYRLEDYITAKIVENNVNLGDVSTGTVFYEFGQVESKSTRTYDLNSNNVSFSNTLLDYGTNWVANNGRPENITVYNDIDPNGNNSLSSTISYTYNADGDVSSKTTDAGNPYQKITTYTYGDFGNLEEEHISPTGITPFTLAKYLYTSDGKFVSSKEDAEGYITTFDYGNLNASWGNVLSSTDHQGIITNTEYDAINRVTSVTDANKGVVKNISYTNASVLPYSSSLPNARFASLTTNNVDASFTCSILDRYGRELRNVHSDFNGNPINVDKSYNNSGAVETETKPYDASVPLSKVETIYSYNDYNMPVFSTENPGGPVIQTDYNIINGKLHTTVTNTGTGKTRTTISCGSIVDKIVGNNETIEYTYYGNGIEHTTKVNSTVDPSSGNTVTKELDAHGRLKWVDELNTGRKRYIFDALDRLVYEELPSPDPSSNSNYSYSYDKIGRLLEKKQTVAPYTTYTYQYHPANSLFPILSGLLSEESISTGYKFIYDYNSRGELQQKKELLNGSQYNQTLYEYYQSGKLKYYTFYNDIRIYYEYNGAGGMNKASVVSAPDPNMIHPLWFIWGKDPYGQLESAYIYSRNGAPLAGGGASNVIYDIGVSHNPHGYVTERYVNRKGTLGMIPNIIHDSYDFNTQTGNLDSRTNIAAGNYTERFSYDTEYDRLTEVNTTTIPSSTFPDLKMEYENNGNIIHKSDVSSTTLYPWKYDMYALKVIPQPSTPWPSMTRTSEIPFNTLQTDYYPFHKIKMVNESNENEVFFTYGVTDERIKAEYYKLLPTKTLMQTKHYGDNYEKIIDKLGNTTELFYIWGGADLLAVLKTYTPAGSTTTTGNVYYPVRDYLGTITHFLDDLGTGGIAGVGVVEERSYDAWGRMRDPLTLIPYENGAFPTGSITDCGYTGHEHIGLGVWHNNIINMNGRLYDPLIGRMFSPDNVIASTTNSQDYNKYTYARNNPLKYTDPDGNNPIWIGAAFGGVTNVVNYALKGQVNSVQDGMKYFAVGALSGGAGAAIGYYTGGFTLSNAIITGSLSGFATSFISSVGNSLAMGEGLYNSTSSGVMSGFNGAINGGLSAGTVRIAQIGVIIGCQTVTGSTRTGPPTEAERERGRTFNENSTATDEILRREYLARFPGEYNRHGLRSVTTIVRGGYGVASDGSLVTSDGVVAEGVTINTVNGSTVYISPRAMQYLSSPTTSYKFTEVLGHELIHSYHYFAFPNRQFNKPNSERVAYDYSIRIYTAAGDMQGVRSLIQQQTAEMDGATVDPRFDNVPY